jgi:CYTH domain-containing protein
MNELNRLFGLVAGLEDAQENNVPESNTTESTPADEPTDNEEASAPKNQVEEPKDESVQQTVGAPTNQPDEVENGKTAVEKELDYWARILDFSQFKEAVKVEKIKDYVSIQEVDDTHPVKSKTRVRRIESKEGVKFELTIKVGNDVTQRMENTTEITEDTFNIMAVANSQYITAKHRYHYQNEDGDWVVDLFPNGKGGYYEWAHVEVEVKELPEKAPSIPIKAEEVIYPKGHNTKLTDEEAQAKVKEITATIDTLDTPIYEETPTEGEVPQEPGDSDPPVEDTNTKETSTEETEETPKEEKEPLTADDISRKPEQVEENEETLKEQGLSEAEGDSTEDTTDTPTEEGETNTEGNTEESNGNETDKDAASSETDSESTGESTTDETGSEIPDETNDEKDKTNVKEATEAFESLLSGLESLIDLRQGVQEDIANGIYFNSRMRHRIHQAVHQAIPASLLSEVHYVTRMELFNDTNTGGFTEETLDVIENGIATLLGQITQQVNAAVNSIDSAAVADTINMRPTLMRLQRRTQTDTGTVDTDVTVLAKDTLEKANEFSQGNRIAVYQSLLKGVLVLMNHYHSDTGFTDELKQALRQFTQSAKAILIPKLAVREDESYREFEVYKVSVPGHVLTYVVYDTDEELLVKVSNGQVAPATPEVATTLPANEDIVPHTDNVPDPGVGKAMSIKEMTDAINQSVDAKLALGQYMTNLSNTIPALAMEVKNKIAQAGYLNKDTIGAGELHLLTTITSVLNLIREEVQFIVHLSQIDGTLKEYANKLLFEVDGGV